MKKILKIIPLLCLALSLQNCDPETIVFKSDSFAQVDGTSASIVENEDSIVTNIQLGGPNESGVDVTFTVTSDDPSRYTFSPSSGSVTIPAGQTSAEIVINPVDNFDVDGDIEVTITLTGGTLPVGIAGDGLELVSKTITIIDNDCPIDIDSFVGTYTVSENFTAGVNSPFGLSDFFGEAYQMEIALLPGDITGTKVVLTNSTGFNVYIEDGTVMSFDTCNGRISFDAGFPTVALFRTFEFTGSSYDESTNTIQATGPLATFGEYQFTFTKQ